MKKIINYFVILWAAFSAQISSDKEECSLKVIANPGKDIGNREALGISDERFEFLTDRLILGYNDIESVSDTLAFVSEYCESANELAFISYHYGLANARIHAFAKDKIIMQLPSLDDKFNLDSVPIIHKGSRDLLN
jgi:hypothetical protein